MSAVHPERVWIIGATLADANAYVAARPELAGASVVSPRTQRWGGMSVERIITTLAFEQLIAIQSAEAMDARRLRMAMSRHLLASSAGS